MKAAVRSRYSPPDVLSVRDIEKPVPKDGEVLIRVHAASVNRSDYHVLTGVPWPMRCFTGLFRPTLASTGSDFAGHIESTGSKVRRFEPGENVMGFGGVFGVGSHAQYLAFDESRGVVSMPDNVTYVQGGRVSRRRVLCCHWSDADKPARRTESARVWRNRRDRIRLRSVAEMLGLACDGRMRWRTSRTGEVLGR